MLKIIKYHFLDSKSSINSIAINCNNQYLALGNSNNQIIIYNYQHLLIFYKSKPIPDQSYKIDKDIDSYAIRSELIPNITLDFHTSEISSLEFSKTLQSILFSASYDQYIAVWKITQLEGSFAANKIRIIKLDCEITQISLYPDDSYLFASCFDGNIYIFKTDYQNDVLKKVQTASIHDNIVNCLVFDPDVIHTGNFASLSDKGKLVIATYDAVNNKINVNYIYEDFINEDHKCNILHKKIDWSIDTKWIISVDHHKVKDQKIIHCRLIDTNKIENSQILIGQESPVYIAKFSKCLYSDKINENAFYLCATADKNGSIIIWKILNNEYSALMEINSYSESNITDLLWSSDGKYLFSVNSTGSFCAIELGEVNIKVFNKEYNYKLSNDNNTNIKTKKRIVPTLISQPSIFERDFINSSNLANPNDNSNSILNNNSNKEISNNDHILKNDNQNNNFNLMYQNIKQQYKKLEYQKQEIEIQGILTKDNKKLVITYENNPYENFSTVEIRCIPNKFTININDFVLYANKFQNRMIKYFTINNKFYAFYDTNFTLNVYSLLNAVLISKMYFEEITYLTNYDTHLILLTSENRLVIINAFSQETILDEYLNLNCYPNNIFQTKINDIYCINKQQILIRADSYNPYNNVNNKMIFYFIIRNKQLLLSSNNDFTEEEKILIRNSQNINNENDYYAKYFKEKIEFNDQIFKNKNDFYLFSDSIRNIYENINKATDKYKILEQAKNLFALVSKSNKLLNYIADEFINICKLRMSEEDVKEIKNIHEEVLKMYSKDMQIDN